MSVLPIVPPAARLAPSKPVVIMTPMRALNGVVQAPVQLDVQGIAVPRAVPTGARTEDLDPALIATGQAASHVAWMQAVSLRPRERRVRADARWGPVLDVRRTTARTTAILPALIVTEAIV